MASVYQSIKEKLVAKTPSESNYLSNSPKVYQIEVRANEGRNLMAADSNGFSDPYVKLCIRSESSAPKKVKYYKTKYIKKTLNPVWNESFILNFDDPKTDFLHIEVWDKDFIKPDDPIGYIFLKLDNLQQGKEVTQWLQLVSVPTGEISISIKALNFSSSNPNSLINNNAAQLTDSGNLMMNNALDPSTYTMQSYDHHHQLAPPPHHMNMAAFSIHTPPSQIAIDPSSYVQTNAAFPPMMNMQSSYLAPMNQPQLTMSANLPIDPNTQLQYNNHHHPLAHSVNVPLSPPQQTTELRSSSHDHLYQTATSQGFDIDYSQIKFISRIGSGAFGEVWKAEWAGTTVAVKKILKSDISDEDLQEFSHEILLMSKLRHPNIVQFLGACLKPEFCLITEFMDRGSLYHVLADESIQLTWDVRLQFASDIARGMYYLHTRTPPIIHRDIKSLNILVTKDWKSTISDFGLTQIKDKSLGSDSKVGSPAWSAPEVLRSEEYNEKADVFSYAIVLWEIITRQTPYAELSNPMQLIGQVAYQKPSLRPPIPECPVPDLVNLMTHCWSDDANDRPDFHSILESLKSISKSYSENKN